jgi:hypothetical protein
MHYEKQENTQNKTAPNDGKADLRGFSVSFEADFHVCFFIDSFQVFIEKRQSERYGADYQDNQS